MISPAELLGQAAEASIRAYAPYSGLKVGAALESTDGSVYIGGNVENASYGLTMCAERVALFKAVSDGKTGFSRVALAAPESPGIVPCGACLQVLAEFSPDMSIITLAQEGKIEEKPLRSCLPEAFRL